MPHLPSPPVGCTHGIRWGLNTNSPGACGASGRPWRSTPVGTGSYSHAQWDAHNSPAAHCSALAEQSSSPGWGHRRRSPACQAGQLFDSEAEWFCSPFWNSSILWLEPVTAGTGLSLVSAGLKGKSSLVLSASATVPTLWLQFLLFNPPWPQSFSYKCTLT